MNEFFDERSHYLKKQALDATTRFWRNPASAIARFDAVLDSIPLSNSKILDVGCGSGALVVRMKERGINYGHYFGVDLVADFIAEAPSNDETIFQVGDFADESCELPQADWVIAIGFFGHAQINDGWDRRFSLVTDRMWALCKAGIAFTLTSSFSPSRNPEAHYANPAATLSEIQNRFGHRALLNHRYLPNDFLIVVQK